MMTPEEYEAKRQARYDRLLAAAERTEKEGRATKQAGEQMFDGIPLGQPILIGHYTEGRDRRYRERARNKISRGYEMMKRAEDLRERAEAVANCHAIFSDDPQAVEKLGGKIHQLEVRQEAMKQTNKLLRAGDLDSLRAMGYTDAQIAKLQTPDFCGRVGFPDYALTNNSANIRRMKQRSARVERAQAMEDTTETVGDVKIEYSPSENRIRIFYGGRVDRETFDRLRQYGFRVLRSAGEGVFSGYYNHTTRNYVEKFIKGKE